MCGTNFTGHYPGKSVRICGDYKLTVNQASKLEQYPIPKLEDLLEKLSGGEKYSKLDLSHAYQQVILDEESKRYITLNTHKGLFCRLVWLPVLPFFNESWRVTTRYPWDCDIPR